MELPKDIFILILDDERTPDMVFGNAVNHEQIHVDQVYSYEEFISLLDKNIYKYDLISFDHDLGEEKTGKDAAFALLDHAVTNDKTEALPKFSVHSSNPLSDKIVQMLNKHMEHVPIRELRKYGD